MAIRFHALWRPKSVCLSSDSQQISCNRWRKRKMPYCLRLRQEKGKMELGSHQYKPLNENKNGRIYIHRKDCSCKSIERDT